jgi:hypothetical protein
VPGSIRRAHDAALDWAAELRGQSAVLICSDGLGLSADVAALLRDAGVSAETPEYGFAGWIKSGHTRLTTRAGLPELASPSWTCRNARLGQNFGHVSDHPPNISSSALPPGIATQP